MHIFIVAVMLYIHYVLPFAVTAILSHYATIAWLEWKSYNAAAISLAVLLDVSVDEAKAQMSYDPFPTI